MSENEFSRRDLTRRAAGSALVMTAASYARILGANDKVPLGVIGCGGRGRHVMGLFQQNPRVTVAALCDVYGQRIDQARQTMADARSFSDHRKLLEMKELAAVYIATPDHWHAATAIDALNAG